MSKPFEVKNGRFNKKELKHLEQRVLDKKTLVSSDKQTQPSDIINLDMIKAAFIGDGLNALQISKKFGIPLETIRKVIDEGKLIKLRRIHVRDGLHSLQNKQVQHAQDLLTLENSFKQMKIQQLKTVMEDYMTYLSFHGDFYQRDSEGEIKVDHNGIPCQIPLPDAAKDIKQLKDALVMGEGLKKILEQIQLVLEGDEVSGHDLDLEEMFLEAQHTKIK